MVNPPLSKVIHLLRFKPILSFKLLPISEKLRLPALYQLIKITLLRPGRLR